MEGIVESSANENTNFELLVTYLRRRMTLIRASLTYYHQLKNRKMIMMKSIRPNWLTAWKTKRGRCRWRRKYKYFLLNQNMMMVIRRRETEWTKKTQTWVITVCLIRAALVSMTSDKEGRPMHNPPEPEIPQQVTQMHKWRRATILSSNQIIERSPLTKLRKKCKWCQI